MAVKSRTNLSGYKRKRPNYIPFYIAILGLSGILARPVLMPLIARMAVVSAAVAMPEGTLELLRERYGHDVDPGIPLEPPPESSASQEPSESSSQPSSDAPSSSSQPQEGPEIEEKYRGVILEEQFVGKAGAGYIQFGNAWLRNYTKLTDAKVNAELNKPLELALPKTSEPTVLIIHTHATESFEEYERNYYDIRNSWRSTDNTKNMVRVGEELVRQLEAKGLTVLHDTTQHDYPSYNGAYERSAATIKKYLKQYPSIKVVFDMHRDAMERSGNVVVAPTAVIGGKKTAQIMVIAGCDNGTMNMPGWPANLRFAAALTSHIEGKYPGLMRPILFDYRKYNMDLSKGLLLIEFGAGGNSMEEVLYCANLAGGAIGEMLAGLQK